MLAAEIQEEENEGNKASSNELTTADVGGENTGREISDPSLSTQVPCTHSYDIVNDSEQRVSSESHGVVSTPPSAPDGTLTEEQQNDTQGESYGVNQAAGALASDAQSESIKSRNSGLVRQHSRHIAAALMATRPKIAQRTLSLTPGNDSIRLSQPAVEMNLGRWSGDFARGWGNFTSIDNPSTVVTAEEVNGVHETSLANSRSEHGQSLNLGRQQILGARAELTMRPIPPIPTPSISHQTMVPAQTFAPDSEVFISDNSIHGRQADVRAGPSSDHFRQQRESVNCSDSDSTEVENVPVEKKSGSVSPVPGGDVVSKTAERLCAVTRGFYLCCCCQSQWKLQ